MMHCRITVYIFSPDERLCYVISTRKNCCEFLATDAVILQSDYQSDLDRPLTFVSIKVIRTVFYSGDCCFHTMKVAF